MTYLETWEDFAKQAEKIYLADPLKARFVIKYRHSQGNVVLKVTDDQVCVQYKSECSQDLKKIEKLTTQLMRHMASRDVQTSVM